MRSIISSAFILGLFMAHGSISAQQLSSTKPPETFNARAEILGQEAGMTANVIVHIAQYTSDKDRTTMQEALKSGGYQALLPVLRKAPEVGYIEMNGRRVATRWARQEPKPGGGRTISVVAESPLAFVGGGSVDAKPRDGFDLAVVLLDVDVIGIGTGSLAPAAHVGVGGPTGVKIDDYGSKLARLVTVTKSSR